MPIYTQCPFTPVAAHPPCQIHPDAAWPRLPRQIRAGSEDKGPSRPPPARTCACGSTPCRTLRPPLTLCCRVIETQTPPVAAPPPSPSSPLEGRGHCGVLDWRKRGTAPPAAGGETRSAWLYGGRERCEAGGEDTTVHGAGGEGEGCWVGEGKNER